MDLFEAVKKRRSVREYSDKPVLKSDLEKIIDAARFAATARNIQPWKFLIVTNKQMLKKIADLTEHGKFIEQAQACIVVLSSDTKYYLEDGSAATQNILLAATSLGLGTCWVAGDKKDYCEGIMKLLGIAKDYKVISFVSVGYPKKEAALKEVEKKSLKELLFWEKF